MVFRYVTTPPITYLVPVEGGLGFFAKANSVDLLSEQMFGSFSRLHAQEQPYFPGLSAREINSFLPPFV